MLTETRTEYEHMTWEACLDKWPRLVKCMQWVACLSKSEAACAIRDYRDARAALMGDKPYGTAMPGTWTLADLFQWGEDIMRWGGCEAVAHFGGPRAVVQSVTSRRQYVAQIVRKYR
jgi:hypothetical protein